jgi:hypothetical protein
MSQGQTYNLLWQYCVEPHPMQWIPNGKWNTTESVAGATTPNSVSVIAPGSKHVTETPVLIWPEWFQS